MTCTQFLTITIIGLDRLGLNLFQCANHHIIWRLFCWQWQHDSINSSHVPHIATVSSLAVFGSNRMRLAELEISFPINTCVVSYVPLVWRMLRKSLEQRYAADCSPVNDDKYYSNRFSHQVTVMPVRFQIN